ncbi:PhnD/SsuA/transferrin family substrate-binding protein [Trichlorobacter lovleyi]|uniref:ABC transporter, substrate-binding protein, putative n=1 Tax=Trichlorobacter lovleyi (strain ATCC BAA-1151 / DSM 17278 / SZ) TaxID=398767 RepID=B3E244_TRIL1|nr:PhnD/SsuA/transferrin family substrate-binding protein [Trichlorobacter lovleyi]ACD97147.1 ABC transporter, substrate-binding protein, putative [Trichlorobacter lovleyi SZ]
MVKVKLKGLPWFAVVLLVCLFAASGQTEGRELVYTPLPIEQPETVIAANRPLVSYLAKQLKTPIAIRYEKNYEDILRLFQEGKIDIVHLGPLPYVILRNSYTKAESLVAINEPDGKATYTCAMVTAFDGPLSVEQVRRSIAFSQPLSTCGHLTAGYLLDKHGVKLEALHHDYLGNQDQVALAVVKGTYEVGTLKTAVAKKYASLTLRIIEETPAFPGFLLVANRATVTPEQIREIRKLLLGIASKDRAALVMGQHGFAPVLDANYDLIRQNLKFFR